MGSVFRVSVIAGLLAVVASAAMDTAAAESSVCSSLRRQLGSSSDGGGGQVNSRAVQQQAIVLQQTRIRAREAGCTGVLFTRGDPAQCAKFDRAIDKISAKLDELKSGGSSSGSSRQRIEASLRANGCDTQRPKKFLEVLFGRSDPVETMPRSRNSDNQRQQAGVITPQAETPKNQAAKRRADDSPETFATSYEGSGPQMSVPVKKGYRTLCVRTCDGYYFPISFSTAPKNFTRDQNACSAMCPAGDAKLYYHAVPDQESGDMISVVGKTPYSELPNAFQYRTEGVRAVPGCACHAAAAPQAPMDLPVSSLNQDKTETSTKVISISSPAYGMLNSIPEVDKAVNQPDQKAGTDQKTDPLNLSTATNGPLISQAANQNVRMIGPRFFPKKNEAIDLRTPPHKTPAPPVRYTPEMVITTVVSDILKRLE